jgi:DNA-binding transcriptional regulator YbjK
MNDLSLYPGGDLVAKGLADIEAGHVSEEALLVLLASPRLAWLGIEVQEVPGVPEPYEHELYRRLEARLGRGAHSAYNALIRRIVSFAQTYAKSVRAAERGKAPNAERGSAGGLSDQLTE